MIHLRLALIILIFSMSIGAMESPDMVIRPYRCCPDSFGKVEKKKPVRTREEVVQWALRVIKCELDTFDKHLCNSEQTVDCDDSECAITVQNDLFKRMLVHVYHSNAGRRGASEIVDRIMQKLIDPNTENVAITKKDLYHRLLSFISWNGLEDHGTCFPLLIKNKIFFLKIKSCIHKQTAIQACSDSVHRRITGNVTDSDQIAQEFNKLLALTKIG